MELKNNIQLSPEKLSLLSREFKCLDEIKAGLTQQVLSYIVDNESEEVLVKLGECSGCGSLVGVSSPFSHRRRNGN